MLEDKSGFKFVEARKPRANSRDRKAAGVPFFIFSFSFFNLKAPSLKRRLLFVIGFQQNLLCERVPFYLIFFILRFCSLKEPSLKRRLLG